jgi:hypothetical protein
VVRIKTLLKILGKILEDFLKPMVAKAQGRITTTQLVNIIFNFCELYSGVVFYPYQEQFSKRIIRSVLENDGEEITGLFSRQSGKSETVATTVGGLLIILPRLANMPMFEGDKRLEMFKDGLWVGIFAPSLRQAQGTYNRIRKRMTSKSARIVLADPDFNLVFETSNGQTCSLSNGSFVTCFSASDGANIEGESFKMLICEECQDISNYKIRKSIHPMGASFNSTIVKIGTPTTFKGDFYEAIERNKRNHLNGESKYKNHYEYNYKVVIKYNPRYEKYVEKEKKRYGENSDEYRMSYKLEWIFERGMFIDIDKFEKDNGNDLLTRIFYDKAHAHVAGIDLASVNDSTVVTMVEPDWENPVIQEASTENEEEYTAYNTAIKDWLEIQGDNYEDQYFQILEYLEHFWVKKIVIDATRESSVAHRMMANLNIEIEPFVYSTPSKSELYKHMASELKTKRAKFPMNEEVIETREYQRFLQQMGDLQKDYRGKFLVVSHPPVADGHDDYPDSWALALWGCKSPTDSTSIETKDKNTMLKDNIIIRTVHHRNKLTAKRR